MTEKNHLSSGALPRSSGGAGGGAVVKGLVDKIKQKITYPPLPASAEEASGRFLQALSVIFWRLCAFLFMLFVFLFVFISEHGIFGWGLTAVDALSITGFFTGFLHANPVSFVLYAIAIAIYQKTVMSMLKKYNYGLETEIKEFISGFYSVCFSSWLIYLAIQYMVVYYSSGSPFMPDYFRFEGKEFHFYQLFGFFGTPHMGAAIALLAGSTAVLTSLLNASKKHLVSGDNDEKHYLICRKICVSLVLIYWFTPGIMCSSILLVILFFLLL